jgi:hypothetical protein
LAVLLFVLLLLVLLVVLVVLVMLGYSLHVGHCLRLR